MKFFFCNWIFFSDAAIMHSDANAASCVRTFLWSTIIDACCCCCRCCWCCCWCYCWCCCCCCCAVVVDVVVVVVVVVDVTVDAALNSLAPSPHLPLPPIISFLLEYLRHRLLLSIHSSAKFFNLNWSLIFIYYLTSIIKSKVEKWSFAFW